MMNTRIQLKRLLAAVKRGRAKMLTPSPPSGERAGVGGRFGVEIAEEMPPHLKTRLLAHWRSMGNPEDWFLPLALRRALICAGLVMMICLAWSSSALLSETDDDVDIANFELRKDVSL